jgi:hypothetical protein
MKRLLRFITRETGMILPSVLFLTAFVLLNFGSNLTAYQHDLKITNSLIEQVNAQTLYQMGYTSYKNDYLSNTIVEENTEYQFPNGKVVVHPTLMEDFLHLTINIQTHQNYKGSVQKSIKNISDE